MESFHGHSCLPAMPISKPSSSASALRELHALRPDRMRLVAGRSRLARGL